MIRADQEELRGHLKELVRESVEETLNAMLDAEADAQCGAKRYERTPERLDKRAGHYERKLLTSSGKVTLSVPRLRKLKLTVNETKTHVCRLPVESFDFLGYTFGRMYSPRTGGAYLGATGAPGGNRAAHPYRNLFANHHRDASRDRVGDLLWHFPHAVDRLGAGKADITDLGRVGRQK